MLATKNLHYFPIAVFVWFHGTFGISYVWAVCIKDVPVFYPYISDTGTFSPESCIFGQMLNMGSILMGIVMYLRYRQVRYLCENHSLDKDVRKLNRISLWLGVIASFGISIVANFQETNIFSVHLFGAWLAFGLGTIYMFLVTKISFKIFPLFGTKYGNYSKAIFTVLCWLNSTVCFVTAVLSFLAFDGTDMTKWTEKQGGYKYHVVSSITEWITAISMMCFIVSFTNDFKLLSLEEPPAFVVDNNVVAHSPPESERPRY